MTLVRKDGRIVDTETGEIDDEIDERTAQRYLEGLLWFAFKDSEEAAKLNRTKAKLFGTNTKPSALRSFLEAHPDVELQDGEHGVYVERREDSTGDQMDIRSFAEQHPDALLALAAQGLLQMNWPAWKGSDKNFAAADAVKGFVTQGGTKVVLSLKRRQ